MRSLPIAALTFALGTVMTPAAAQSPAEFYKADIEGDKIEATKMRISITLVKPTLSLISC
jgi:hypothetical protein